MADIDVLSRFPGGELIVPTRPRADRKARNESSAEVLSLFFSLGCMQLGQVSYQFLLQAKYS
jgi:hypothetical protein